MAAEITNTIDRSWSLAWKLWTRSWIRDKVDRMRECAQSVGSCGIKGSFSFLWKLNCCIAVETEGRRLRKRLFHSSTDFFCSISWSFEILKIIFDNFVRKKLFINTIQRKYNCNKSLKCTETETNINKHHFHAKPDEIDHLILMNV